MNNIFTTVAAKKPRKNVFDLTHDVKMSGRMGNLMPCCVIEAVPGDSFTLGSDVLCRFAPLIAPVMHRMDLTIHYFFVPNRILWDNWKKFITNEEPVVAPYIELTGGESPLEKRFLDYLGIPPKTNSLPVSEKVSALPMAAYQAIYNEYYRDENLIPEVDYKLQDGVNVDPELLVLRKRSLEHDYFTACLPFAQKGTPVDIPFGNIELDNDWYANGSRPSFDGNGITPTGTVDQTLTGATPEIGVGGNKPSAYDPQGSLIITGTTINDFRRAEKLQEWLEKNARGGTRYTEQIRAHFGVVSSDARLQRPEYITGMKSPVIISEVLNTTGQDGGLPQGNMAGHAVTVGNGYKGNYFVEEHGYIIGIMSVMPKTAYQQGIPRNYLKFDPLDYYWPSFANIGEQEVKNREIYAFTGFSNSTFGYIPRYAEYKYMPSRVAGDFRTTLDYWHLGRIFSNLPTLSQEFLEVTDEDVDRIFAVNNGDDNLYIQVLNKVKAVRPMPVFGTPML